MGLQDSRARLDDSMFTSDSANHSEKHGPGGVMALRHFHGHSLQPTPGASMWSLVATWTRDVSIDHGVVVLR